MQLRNEYPQYFLAGKGGQCVGLTILPPQSADCHEIWEPQGPSRTVQRLLMLRCTVLFLLLSQITITTMLLLLIIKKIRLGVAYNDEY